MPVAERDVIEIAGSEPLQIDEIRDAAIRFFVVRCTTETLDAPVRDYDPRLASKPSVQFLRRTQPGRGIARLVPAEQRTREQHGVLQLDRFRAQQDMEIGRELLLLPPEKFLVPQAARPAVVVVAGDDIDRHRQRSDGPAGGGDRGFCCGWRIE